MKKLCLIIPLYFIPLLGFAQYGCLIPGYPELLTYQTNPPGGIFSTTPGELYPANGCNWKLDSSLPSTGCVGHGRAGVKGTFYQECPVDGFTPLLFIFTAGMAFLTFKRKPTQINNENLHHYSNL